MISMSRLSDVFVEAADTLVADFDLVDFLHSLAHNTQTITGSRAVGVMLTDQDGQLRYMASSTENARLLDLYQIQNDEGPCLECAHSGAEVSHDDLRAAADRWPVFAPRALTLGFTAVHALPMRLRDQVIGAVNVFRDDAPMNAEETRVARALADVAAIAIIQERAITRAEALTEQLQGALNSRVVIEQAKGAVARTFGVDVEMAFEVLRAHARSEHRRLTDVAKEMVTDHRRIQELRGHLPHAE